MVNGSEPASDGGEGSGKVPPGAFPELTGMFTGKTAALVAPLVAAWHPPSSGEPADIRIHDFKDRSRRYFIRNEIRTQAI
jgi:hypothetical protein